MRGIDEKKAHVLGKAKQRSTRGPPSTGTARMLAHRRRRRNLTRQFAEVDFARGL